MSFAEKYGIDNDTHKIDLEGTTFTVKLPNESNKRYQRAVVSFLTVRSDEGYVPAEVDLDKMVLASVRAFARTCVISCSDPTIILGDDLYEKYPDAVEELYAEAGELAERISFEEAETAKKSLTTSSGSAA